MISSVLSVRHKVLQEIPCKCGTHKHREYFELRYKNLAAKESVLFYFAILTKITWVLQVLLEFVFIFAVTRAKNKVLPLK